MPANRVFRQSALDRLAAPEELDKMVQVTNRRGWFALLGLVSVVGIAIAWSVFSTIPIMMRGSGILVRQDGVQELKIAENGQLTELKIKAGDTVSAGQEVALVRTAAGNEVSLKSSFSGKILELNAAKGALLKAESSLGRVEVSDRPLKGIVLLPLVEGKRLTPGAKVQISPSNVLAQEYGYLLGTVTYVSDYPITTDSLMSELKSRELVQMLAAGGALIRADVELDTDANSPSGFKWSSSKGPPMQMSNGTLFFASLVIGEQRPISLVLPVLK